MILSASTNPETFQPNQGPGTDVIRFCASSILALVVLDDDAMELVRERKDAVRMVRAQDWSEPLDRQSLGEERNEPVFWAQNPDAQTLMPKP